MNCLPKYFYSCVCVFFCLWKIKLIICSTETDQDSIICWIILIKVELQFRQYTTITFIVYILQNFIYSSKVHNFLKGSHNNKTYYHHYYLSHYCIWLWGYKFLHVALLYILKILGSKQTKLFPSFKAIFMPVITYQLSNLFI